MKITKLEETQKELEVYREECVRLRELLSQSDRNIRAFSEQVAKIKESLRASKRRRKRLMSIEA